MGREGAKDTVPEAGGHPIRVGLVLEVMIQMEPLHTWIMAVKSSTAQANNMSKSKWPVFDLESVSLHYTYPLGFKLFTVLIQHLIHLTLQHS